MNNITNLLGNLRNNCMAVGFGGGNGRLAVRVLPSQLQKMGYIAASLSGAFLGVKRPKDE